MISDFLRSLRQCIPGCDCLLCERKAVGSQIRIYERLAQAFNPVLFCADDWVQLAQEAGMQYIVVTAKHHEGFALFDTNYDRYNCVTGAPFGRDLIAELAEACAKHHMKLGLYYSQELDWHEPDGGGYGARELNCGCMSWTNDWDFPDNAHKNYTRLFESKIKMQAKGAADKLRGAGSYLV